MQWIGPIVPANRLWLTRYWRFDNDAAYAIWEVIPVGQTHDLLGGSAQTVNALAELRFAAEAFERFEVVKDEDFDAVKVADEAKILLASIPREPSGDLLHVLVTVDELTTLYMPPSQVRPEHPVRCQIGSTSLELYGCDLMTKRVRAGGRLVVSRFWRARGAGALPESVSMTLVHADRVDGEARVHVDAPICRGTLPGSWLSIGNAVVDTLSLKLPDSLPPGQYSLRVHEQTVVTGITVTGNTVR